MEEHRGMEGGEGGEGGGSSFSPALYLNPGFGSGMREAQVQTNTSNNSSKHRIGRWWRAA